MGVATRNSLSSQSSIYGETPRAATASSTFGSPRSLASIKSTQCKWRTCTPPATKNGHTTTPTFASPTSSHGQWRARAEGADSAGGSHRLSKPAHLRLDGVCELAGDVVPPRVSVDGAAGFVVAVLLGPGGEESAVHDRCNSIRNGFVSRTSISQSTHPTQLSQVP